MTRFLLSSVSAVLLLAAPVAAIAQTTPAPAAAPAPTMAAPAKPATAPMAAPAKPMTAPAKPVAAKPAMKHVAKPMHHAMAKPAGKMRPRDGGGDAAVEALNAQSLAKAKAGQ